MDEFQCGCGHMRFAHVTDDGVCGVIDCPCAKCRLGPDLERDCDTIRDKIKEILGDRRNVVTNELSVQMLAAALGVLEAGGDFTTNLEDEGLQEEYDRGRNVGAFLPGGVDFVGK